ncbi:DUF5906 domain-containing protein [Shinella sp. DD12]|uniref:DUF5906 domain-containing protein n=1 Tax=Shinella sp. DD12 TaxID=1410620 RepID=UPI0012DE0F78|nr:DUF5906 domain-containing protein [Shinella sp. DD12]
MQNSAELTPTETRLKTLENGYTPIRNRDKATYMKGWPDTEITEAEIKSWSRMRRDAATGIRVENGLAVIDVDVDDKGMVETFRGIMMDVVPELELEETPWLERHSGKAKVAWFFRTDEPFGKLKTAVFVPPGFKPDDPDAPTGFVEIFGGASARQFGAFGPHSHDERGAVVRSYCWGERSPLDTRLEELPVITKVQFVELSHRFAEALKAASWTIQPLTRFSDHAGGRDFKLTEDGPYHCIDGVSRSLTELQAAAGGRDALRCSMSWKEGPQAKNRTRGLVGLTAKGVVFVHDTQDAVTYLPISAKPTTAEQDVAKLKTEEMVKAMAEKMNERRVSPARLKIKRGNGNDGDDHDTALAKFVQLYAYCPTSPLPVVPIHPEATNGEGAMTVANARLMMLPHAKEELGPKGGVHKTSVVDSWLNSDRLITVAGVRVAPGKEWPVYKEDGATYINRYRPPAHPVGVGSPDTLLAFVAHLVPHTAEREWLLDRLAHKLAHPDIPGPAVIFVAHEAFGTGRGTFFRLLRALIGPKYSCELPFADFMGKHYQSQYNEWLTKLLVCVNESSDEQTGSRYGNRRADYEHLKELCEPRPHDAPIRLKGVTNYTALVSASFFIATNHADALPLPDDDRRFAVLMNGEKMTPKEARRYNGAVDDPAQVAAFYHRLMTRGYGAFDPFVDPPLFAGKVQMADTGVSDLDEAWADALAALPEVFTMETLNRAVMAEAHAAGAELPRSAKDIIKARAKSNLKRVGVKNGRNGCVRDGARKHTCYCKNAADAKKWTNEDHETLKAAVLGGGGAATIAADNVATFPGLKKGKRGGQYGPRGPYNG